MTRPGGTQGDATARPQARISLNGVERRLEPNATVAHLVGALLPRDSTEGIAVAVNGAVVPRTEWSARKVHDGDTVEVIRAVQGG